MFGHVGHGLGGAGEFAGAVVTARLGVAAGGAVEVFGRPGVIVGPVRVIATLFGDPVERAAEVAADAVAVVLAALPMQYLGRWPQTSPSEMPPAPSA